jgi:hypothetical protein
MEGVGCYLRLADHVRGSKEGKLLNILQLRLETQAQMALLCPVCVLRSFKPQSYQACTRPLEDKNPKALGCSGHPNS